MNWSKFVCAGIALYLLGTMFFPLNQVEAFALHEPEHVEKAVVA